MKKLFLIQSLLCMLFSGSLAWAAQAPVVKILPFAVHTQESLGYLQTQIPQELERRLIEEGAQAQAVTEPDAALADPSRMDLPALRRAGRVATADFLVWGSFSKVGKRYSIDAKIVSTFVETPVQAVYVEGFGMETLMSKVSELGKEVASKVLGRKTVTEIVVAGNSRIESDAILKKIKTQKGDPYSPGDLAGDIRSVFSMGYFDDIRVEAEEAAGGMKIIFTVEEKPTLHVIKVSGNRKIKDEDIMAALDISRGSILNIKRIDENVKKIQELYKEDNFHNAKVTYEITPYKEHMSDLEFQIEEGGKVMIKEIRFDGNKSFADKKLKKVMKTSEKGFFSWITSSGELSMEDLNQDRARLNAWYHNHGYVQAAVSEPEIEIKDQWIYITIKIHEGEQFKVGKVDLSVPEGDTLIMPKEDILSLLKIGKEEVFSREIVQKDVLVLNDVYQDAGYAYADIYPNIIPNQEKLEVDITFDINKAQEVYFERIIIAGNTKTREKVIRRELPIQEKGLYSGTLLKRGVRNLMRLDFFGDVKVDTVKGSADDQMILKINVEEKPTGAFSFGGGYSNTDNAFGMVSIGQRNLFGRGQSLDLKAQAGSSSSKFSLSFSEPWLFDSRLSMGTDLYKWTRDYDTYVKNSNGGALHFGYPVWDYTRVYLSYKYDMADISDVDYYAAYAIQEIEGTNLESSLRGTLAYDSRDKAFNATSGSYHKASLQYAGGPLGGDLGFTKYEAETGWYFPLFWGTVGFLHAEAGYARENEDGILPLYERFYLGGINSLRGFTWEDLSPLDEDGARVGGNKFVQFNVEYHIPVIKKAGLVGVLFYDTGNVWNNHRKVNLSQLRESAGVGIRWYSPMGPIRLERGYILDPQGDENSNGRWEFTMGGAF